MSSAAVIDLSSPARSRSEPDHDAAAMSTCASRRYRLTLVPIKSTFPREFLTGVGGPPTLRLAECDLPNQQQWQQQQSSPRLILGRSESTRIKSVMLSRELLDVRLIRRPRPEQGVDSPAKPSIAVKLLKPKKCVWLNGTPMDIVVNGTREVQAGDTIALYQNQFEYKLHLDEYQPDVVSLLDSSDDEGDGDDSGSEAARVGVQGLVDVEGREGPTVASAAAAESIAGTGDDDSTAEADNRAAAKSCVTDTFICAICYGILTTTQILAPCGHNVCKECAKDTGMFAYLESKQQKKNMKKKKAAGRNFDSGRNHPVGTPTNASSCPECRQEIDSIVPGKIMDNLIWNGMLSGTVEFDVEDIIEHLRKSGAKPTEMEARNIFQRHSTYLADYLETMRDGEEAGHMNSLARSDEGDEAPPPPPPRKRARPENEYNQCNNDDDAIISIPDD